jgi:hypothetical protein
VTFFERSYELAGIRVGVVRKGCGAAPDGATLTGVDFTLVIEQEEGLPFDASVRSPLEITGSGDRITYRSADSELVVEEDRGVLRMSSCSEQAVRRAVRIGVACSLARGGGFLLHAAGVVGPRGALLFFGPSGAGKSTLASTSPLPVLGDELVAVHSNGSFSASAAGFDGDRFSEGPASRHRLAGVFELAKGESALVTPLEAREAVRALVRCAVIPPLAPLWRKGFGTLGRLAIAVPVCRLAWKVGQPPWAVLGNLGFL